jgi:hypothetical protein
MFRRDNASRPDHPCRSKEVRLRFVIIDRGPRFQVPLEQFPALWEQFVGWRERHREKMESFEFFVGGGGGFGVVNVADEGEAQQMLIEYPFSFFDDVELRLIVDGDVSLQRWGEALRAMAGG